MAGKLIFEYKCNKNHLTEEMFPPGTSYDYQPQILCPVCLDEGNPNDAYLVFACPEKWEQKKHA